MALGPTYAEARQWIVWLQVFTPGMLADSMGVHEEVATKFIKAAIWHGIIESTGDHINGSGPAEDIYSYVPLPPGPNVHWTGTPEWLAVAGCYADAPRRGVPVRLVDNTDRRNAMQGTGGARIRIRNRDRAYEAMQQSKMDRAERARQKQKAKSQGMQKAIEAMVRGEEPTTGGKHRRTDPLPSKDRTKAKKTQRKTK